MFPKIELKEGACVISDAHYSHLRPQLLTLLKDIESQKLKTPQLILMGDIFDLLFGGVSDTEITNREMIQILNKISQEIEMIYLEGNHDFNLKNIFPNANVIPLPQQPLICTYENKTVALAHGDFDLGFMYKMYVTIIRNPLTLFVLSFINNNTNNYIINKLNTYLDKKDDCNKFTHFEEYIRNRHLEKYKSDYFIEGHYHQNRFFTFTKFNYINLAAFACNQRYFIVKSFKDNELLKEEKLSQGDG